MKNYEIIKIASYKIKKKKKILNIKIMKFHSFSYISSTCMMVTGMSPKTPKHKEIIYVVLLQLF